MKNEFWITVAISLITQAAQGSETPSNELAPKKEEARALLKVLTKKDFGKTPDWDTGSPCFANCETIVRRV